MTTRVASRPRFGQWSLFLASAAWLAFVPLVVTIGLSAWADLPAGILVELELAAPGVPKLPEREFGLLVTGLTLGLHMAAWLPLYLATREPGREFLHSTSTVLAAISLFQTLNALGRLAWPEDSWRLASATAIAPESTRLALMSALRLALLLPFLLLGLGWIEAQCHNRSLTKAWRRIGLRLWFVPSAPWLALAVGALIVWPWVLVGALGSPGTTAANLLQALPNALSEETLFRGVAFAWLWRAARSRKGAAASSLVLYIAAQGGSILPNQDLGVFPRFLVALLLGLLFTELTIRARGSIWPAIVVHILYDWFHFAFVDPRSREEILHWLAQFGTPMLAGGLGLLLWGGRKLVGAIKHAPLPTWRCTRAKAMAPLAGLAWAGLAILYLTLGSPGFYPDGFLIFLEQMADLGPAASIVDPMERRAWVYRTLVETAERSQLPLKDRLDQYDVPYRSHYLINMIEVQSRPGLRHAFARAPGVESVLFQPGMRRYPRTLGLPSTDSGGEGSVEWNVREVGADRVWELGYTGQGVIVGSADSGVSWTHPALKAAYRGWDGQSSNHNYQWYDPWDGSTEPNDDTGHGTHTTGTVVGRDGNNEIGLAPGARWIACRNMRHGIGNPGSYISCMEFLLAPFPLGGDPFHDGEPFQGAHVVNNSWGCPREEGCLPDTLRTAVINLRAAAQMMVVSAGNEGPGCSTVQSPPALYESVLTVGAVTRADRAAAFSSRGPVTADDSQRRKPDLVAPGEEIRSSVPKGYARLPGTSMAGPHVAGAVALLWSMSPALTGDIERTEAILVESAQELTVDAVCASGGETRGTVCACGSDEPTSVPNNVYGWGEVDVWAASQMLSVVH